MMASYELLGGNQVRIDFSENGTSLVVNLQNGIQLDPSAAGWHEYLAIAGTRFLQEYYELRYWVDFTYEDFNLAMLQQAAPEWRDLSIDDVTSSTPIVRTGSFTDTFGPGGVTHQVSPDGVIVINQTNQQHPLYPGIVARTIVEDSNSIFYTYSYGVGNSNNQGFVAAAEATFNNIAGMALFSDPFVVLDQALVNALSREGRECFPAGTLIQMWDGSLKEIELIEEGDAVRSFDQSGKIVKGIVDNTFCNVTDEWLILSNGVKVTPGHRFLRPDGSFSSIEDIISSDGEIVLSDGSVSVVTADRLKFVPSNYSDTDCASITEFTTEGGLALAPNPKIGWKTYNFSVGIYHTYIAEDIRVHNDSVLSHLQEGDQLLALSADLRDAVFLRNDAGVETVVFLDGYEDTSGQTAIEQSYVLSPSSGVDVEDIAFQVIDDLGYSKAEPSLLMGAIDIATVPYSPFLQVTTVDVAAGGLVLVNGANSSQSWSGTSTSDWYRGNGGNDVISGLSGSDILEGGSGNDSLYGGEGNDLLSGGEGSDWFRGGSGADSIAGGAGIDIVSYTNATSQVNLGLDGGINSTGDAAGDTFSSIEKVWATQYDDNILASSGNETLYGLNGIDQLHGLGGNDKLYGGNGNDKLYGGAGQDFLSGGAGQDLVGYGDAAPGLRVDLQYSSLNLGIAAGDTFSSIELIWGSDHGDNLGGDAGDNRIWGRGGDDTIYGRDGNDILYGGDGADRFIFHNSHGGHDRIEDFEDGVDRIEITGYGFSSVSALMATATETGAGDVVFDIGQGDKVIVIETTIAELSGDVFII